VFTKDGKEIVVCDETRSKLLPLLEEVQDAKGYVSDQDMQEIADRLGIHPVEVYSVVTFYSFLTADKEGKHFIRVSGCLSDEMAGGDKTLEAFEKALGIKTGGTTRDGKITLETTGCIGMCDRPPSVMIDDKLVGGVTPALAKKIVNELKSARPPKKSVMIPFAGEDAKRSGPVIFSPVQPYAGLRKALDAGRSAVLDAVRDSNLKGRGGAGFPTGVKWNLAATAHSEKKFIVCNADEGEPGTFKDRVLITEYPRLIFEGMVIAAFAIGSRYGFLYLRGEYRSFRPMLEKVLYEMRREGALGVNIMGRHGFDFDIEIRLGAGAYICGEETALIESLEGNRGEPRNRPPFPVNTGFEGYPTIVNNVETFVTVPHIIAKGAEWFKKIGTEKSSGSKLVSVSGDCKKPGVYEVPFGTSIREILKLAGGLDAKSVQVGGASGSCVVRAEFGHKIAFEDFATGGSVMIFGKKRKMMDAAENFLKFFAEEHCGQCTPCREGVPVLLEGVRMLKKGECSNDYLKDLLSLGETMQCASKCGLGQSAPNAFMTIVKKFKEEYKLSSGKTKVQVFNG
jgi:[NiFe] hydrogenase diaphorase moiety large subunit